MRRREVFSKQLLIQLGFTNMRYIVYTDVIKIFVALCSCPLLLYVAFQVMVESFTMLMVLDGKPLPEFGGVNQEGYHAQPHSAALVDQHR